MSTLGISEPGRAGRVQTQLHRALVRPPRRRELQQDRTGALANLDAALDSPLERGGETIVGATCASTGPSIQACCDQKAEEGTCEDDPSCISPTNRCGGGGTIVGSTCISTGPANIQGEPPAHLQ